MTFLDDAEVIKLTGRSFKKLQIEALRNMGVPFFINAMGRAVVTRTAVEGQKVAPPSEKKAWVPPGLRSVK
jgi:hypothetical protein